MSSATPPPERDTQLLAVGTPCSAPSCLLVDFLPFKCQHCELRFCAEHFRVEDHKCSKYDEAKFNRVVPSCPLCNKPVAIRPNEDPNIRMEHHITTQCSVMTGRGKAKSSPVCARAKCGKVLFAPIRCNKCNLQFCPEHRFPADHTCAASTTSNVAPKKPSAVTANLKSTANAAIDAFKKLNNTTDSRPTAQLQVAQSASTSKLPSPKEKSSTAPASRTKAADLNPFSKSDRRARSERESRRKAMLDRAKKGLLSEQEMKILNEEMARPQKEGKDCVVM